MTLTYTCTCLHIPTHVHDITYAYTCMHIPMHKHIQMDKHENIHEITYTLHIHTLVHYICMAYTYTYTCIHIPIRIPIHDIT